MREVGVCRFKKLTPEDVEEIRSQKMPRSALGMKFDLPYETVERIQRGANPPRRRIYDPDDEHLAELVANDFRPLDTVAEAFGLTEWRVGHIRKTYLPRQRECLNPHCRTIFTPRWGGGLPSYQMGFCRRCRQTLTSAAMRALSEADCAAVEG